MKLSTILVSIAAFFAVLSVPFSVSADDFVLVIDPGHGGKDYGTVGKITNEKTINLAVALELGRLIKEEYDDVATVFTRSSDVFIPLNERAAIANKAGGDLFISIHVNAVDKKAANRLTVQGASVYTLGLHKSAANLEVAKRENSVMVMEQDYSTSYAGFDPNSAESYIIFELNQNKHLTQSVNFAEKVQHQLVRTAHRADKGVRQAGFWVLWSTGMPSVLVELDFLCNPNQEKYLASEAGQKEMARAIFNAFCEYKDDFSDKLLRMRGEQPLPHAHHAKDKSTSAASAPDTDSSAKGKGKKSAKTDNSSKKATASGDKSKADALPAECYAIQILASASPVKDRSEFKGLDPYSLRDGKWHKYFVGRCSSAAEARALLSDVKAKFPAAFIVHIRNGKPVR
ncbi:MAG: N-acetylmuramoyl-L-alanine amidase [Muribaculaceae bacterium]|nr:N-acetylmuramoyl-L-alanine amidase [Muribaculaceae bacterium]